MLRFQKLVEQIDCNRCGSPLAHKVSRLLSLALPLKNLALIEKSGFSQVMVPCAACYNRFKVAQYEVGEDPELKAKVEDIIEYKFRGKVKVYHPLEVLSSEAVLGRLSPLVKRDLSSLKVVSYYGCLLVRPPKVIQFDDVGEYPQTMDRILRAVGIATLDWSYKTECCGGSLSVTKPEVVVKVCQRILEDARAVGAEAIAVPCTFCHLNLDVRQEEIEKKYGVSYRLPVFYFTELVSLALGTAEDKLLLKMHFVDTRNVLQKVA